MTTKHSPLSVLKSQADNIAKVINAFERGDNIDMQFAKKIEAARAKESFKIGIVMDDKVITIEMSWVIIRNTSEVGLAEYILRQMLESGETVN